MGWVGEATCVERFWLAGRLPVCRVVWKAISFDAVLFNHISAASCKPLILLRGALRMRIQGTKGRLLHCCLLFSRRARGGVRGYSPSQAGYLRGAPQPRSHPSLRTIYAHPHRHHVAWPGAFEPGLASVQFELRPVLPIAQPSALLHHYSYCPSFFKTTMPCHRAACGPAVWQESPGRSFRGVSPEEAAQGEARSIRQAKVGREIDREIEEGMALEVVRTHAV